MSSHKRRQYPNQQIAAYNTGADASAAYYDDGAGVDQSGVFVPAAAAPVPLTPSQLADQVDGLQVGAVPPYGGYSAHAAYSSGPSAPTPMYAPAAAPYGAPVAAPLKLNELVSVDLLKSYPPPVNDLDLPPPPIATPVEQLVTRSEYAQASSEYMRSTLNVIPVNASVLKKSKLPLAIVVRPFLALTDADENVPLVQDLCIARCRRCRAYINPFVQFTHNDHRWICNICNTSTDVPTNFDWDPATQQTANRWERAELNYGVVDYVANSEYLSRPPQPPTYVFLLDTCVGATSSGILGAVADTILASLDRIPNADGRAQVAFIAVDGALNFVQILPPNPLGEQQDARLLVVTDLEEPFLPTNKGLVANLNECRSTIERFLRSLPDLFAQSYASSNAMGSGLKAALKLLSNTGGKIVCVNTTLPSTGLGKLAAREDPKLSGTKNEYLLYSPASSFYKSFAVECNKCQVTVDMFLASSTYQDVATLSNLPKFSGGSTFFYPGWHASKAADVEKLRHELGDHLAQEIGMEGMYRARASSGILPESFSGHFFVRSSDLMTFPTLTRHHSYVVELKVDVPVKRPTVVIQGAFLYTTCAGERRIRVMTQQLPVSEQLNDIYASADQQAIATYFAHIAADKVVTSGYSAANELVNTRLAEIFKTYRADVLNTHTGTSSALSLASNLALLPLLLFSLKKNVGLRKTPQILSDLRVHALDLLQTLPVPSLMKLLYPDFYALHELPDAAGLPDESGQIVLPVRLNLTGEQLQSYGLYLLDDGQVMFLWVGTDVVQQLLIDAFGVDSIEGVPSGKCDMPIVEGSDLNLRIRNLISVSRDREDTVYYPSLYIVHERTDPALKLWVSALLVEDRSESEPTYFQYLNTIYENLSR